MSNSDDRYDAALKRLIGECSNAILKRRALAGLINANSVHGLNFFRVAAGALFNDIVAHSMRVFDKHKDAASLWYVIKCNEKCASSVSKALGLDLNSLDVLSDKLRLIRDKTEFHIDKDAVINPKLVWSGAGISGDQLGAGLDDAFALLSGIRFKRTGDRDLVPEYDGSDVPLIIKAYKKLNPEAAVFI